VPDLPTMLQISLAGFTAFLLVLGLMAHARWRESRRLRDEDTPQA
jgi:hypothetical protein